MKLSPILLFVYNRPWHTEQTLEALRNNELAEQSLLYIYCDGPKPGAKQEDIEKIAAVKRILKQKKWCGEIKIIERTENLGLANSVIQGVSEVIGKHGRTIVLEDDIVTGKHFLNFMNDALRIYEKEEQVFGVSGYCFPHYRKIKDKTFFLPVMSSWGYGTWKDRWERINYNAKELLLEVTSRRAEHKLKFSNIDYLQMLKDQILKKNDSWAVRVYVSMFLEDGLFLYPNESLLKNIGFDGSGVHCKGEPSRKPQKPNNSMIPVSRKKVLLKNKIFRRFNEPVSYQLKKRLKRKLKTLIGPELIQIIKRSSM